MVKMTLNGVTTTFATVDEFKAAYVKMTLRPTDKVRLTVNGKRAAVECYAGNVIVTVF